MGNAVERIKISGFRRLSDIELEMRPLMVLIGANGVGKTSLLDAISLLSASAAGNLNDMLAQWGGANNVLTRSSIQKMSFVLDMLNPGHVAFKYELEIAPSVSGYNISKETLIEGRKGEPDPLKLIDSKNGEISYYDIDKKDYIKPNWEHRLTETSLSQIPKMFVQPDKLKSILSTVTRYHALDVGIRAPVKMPQAMRLAEFPGVNGETLVPYLYHLRESNYRRYVLLEDTLKVVFPDFERLNFPPVAAGMLTMTWSDKKFKEPISIHELSEGTLRFIWLLSILYCPNLSAITMIDEPEVSLHPEMLSILADIMRETSKRTQLIVASHSDRFIRFLQPEEIVVMDIDDDGGATATWADTMDLEHWLVDFGLDEIWRMGIMEGRAW